MQESIIWYTNRCHAQHSTGLTKSCLFANTSSALCRISGSSMICCKGSLEAISRRGREPTVCNDKVEAGNSQRPPTYIIQRFTTITPTYNPTTLSLPCNNRTSLPKLIPLNGTQLSLLMLDLCTLNSEAALPTRSRSQESTT